MSSDPFADTSTLPVELVPITTLRPWPRNQDIRSISPAKLEQLKRTLVADPSMLWARPLVAQPNGVVFMGNQRLRAVTELGWSKVPVVYADLSDDQAAVWAVRDNNEYGEWTPGLAELLRELQGRGSDLDLTGFDEDELQRLLASYDAPAVAGPDRGGLAERFVVPPFSVLDQRAGYWKERRRAWLALGIRSELGRTAAPGSGTGAWLHVDGTSEVPYSGKPRATTFTGQESLNRIMGQDDPLRKSALILKTATSADPAFYEQKRTVEARLGEPLTTAEFLARHYVAPDGAGSMSTTGTSVFDPVLCEIAYRWFSPPAGWVLDPFAGGSVRGIVANELGRGYVGIDLSAEQVAANEAQADEICASVERRQSVRWMVGDAAEVLPTLTHTFDLIFTCPPYFDLESYSDDERDLSSMTTDEFEQAYALILEHAVARLADDSFAVLVVSDVRGADGNYRPLSDMTTRIMSLLGLGLYNRAMLVSPLGSLPIRAGRAFTSTRKLGRTHQDVLVYLKGDARRAVERCGNVDITFDAIDTGDLAEDEQDAPILEPDGPVEEGVAVKVSAANARQGFHGCEPDYIEHVCHGRCCESASAPGGTVIAIHPSEEPGIIAVGGRVMRGLLVTEGRCTFKTATNLCALHEQPEKPFGCIASPFTLNKRGTLIIRNRYRMLRCYNDAGGEHSERGVGAEPLPAYRAFAASLKLLFGDAEAARITAHLDAGGGDMVAYMPAATAQMVRDLDAVKPHKASS